MQNIGALQESLTVGSNPFNTNPRYGQNSQMQANRFVTQSPSGPHGGSGGQYRPNFNRGGNAQGQSRGIILTAPRISAFITVGPGRRICVLVIMYAQCIFA